LVSILEAFYPKISGFAISMDFPLDLKTILIEGRGLTREIVVRMNIGRRTEVGVELWSRARNNGTGSYE
jgi:hypothetical protein